MQWALMAGTFITCAIANMRPDVDTNGYVRDMGWADPVSAGGIISILLSLVIGYGAQLLFWNVVTRKGVPHGQMIAPVFMGILFVPFLVGAIFYSLWLYLF